MTTRNISQATAMLLMMLLSATTAWAQEAISGLTYNTAGGYYEIPDAAALNALAAYVNAGNDASWKTFKQTANITFAHTSDWNDTSSTESNFNGIGNDTDNHPFKGSYYGQGFTISGVRMYVYKEGVGLFGYARNATIDGIVLTDSRITGLRYTGGIVGRTYKDGGNCIFNNCHVRSNVLINHINNNESHGGIVGSNGTGCEVTNCTSAVTIAEGSECRFYGGIVGYNGGIMSNNIAIGVTIGNIKEFYGAIAGYSNGVLSNNYYYDCTVQGRTSNIGCNGADDTYNNYYAVNASPDHFTASGDEYTIKSAAGWNVFCECLNHNDRYNRFSGKTVKLGADIEVSRMAGSDSHDFCGTFDGQKHTLTFNYGKANAYSNEEYIAPFHFVSTVTTNNVEAPAAIKNLHVAGDIYTSAKYTAGLVALHWGTLNVENCRNSIVIHSSVSGDGTHGGFEAVNRGKLNITGCLFDGKLLTTNGTTNCGGFVAWHYGGTTDISNSVYAPAALASGETEVLAGVVNNHPSATFGRDAVNSITNCYYARALGTAQGKAPLTVSGGEHVTVSAVSPVGLPTSSDGFNGVYSVSGITAYAKGIKLGGTFYYGSGDNVSLTLTNTPPTGYSFSAYTASSGTLSGTTLTMPDTDATINATWTPIVYSIAYDLDGGTVATANPTSYNVETATFTLTNPTRTGYTFTGWTGSNGSTPQTTVTIAKGSTENKTYTANWTPDPAHFSVSGNEYTIHSATGWGVFCDALQDNDTWNRFSGKTVKLGANIAVSRMAGSSSHDFCGSFDGDGKTLTFNYSGSADHVAPFSYISTTKPVGSNTESPAAIRRLNVVANITTTGQHAGGIVGEAWGKLTIEHCTVSGTIKTSKQFAGGIIGSVSNSPLNISDCRSSVTISSSVSGDGTLGGFAGRVPSAATLNISGCVFNGKIVTTNGTTNCGGFVGHSENPAGTNVSIANSLYAPAAIADGETEVLIGDVNNDPSSTFARNVIAENITNSYYTAVLGTAQGKAPRTIEAGDNVTVSNIALTGTTTAYTTSGITAYSGGGLSYAENIYYGSGDNVSLTLSHGDRTAYTFGSYTASAGTLNGTENPYTLTMPDDGDVTINAAWTPITYTITYNLDDGTVATANPTTYTVETETFTLNNPTKPGYTFTGWTLDDDNTLLTTVTIEKGSIDHRTYTAHYEVYIHSFSVGDFTFLNTSATEAKVTACNSSTTSVTIPATVTDNEVTYSVTAIDADAFSGCTSLYTVILQATTPPALGASAFDACTALSAIGVPAGTIATYKSATNWSDYNNMIFAIEGTCGDNVYWSYNSVSHTLTIFGTGSMTDGQPWENYRDDITTVIIREGVTSIGTQAFENCTGLTSIAIPASVTTIGDFVFSGCTGLTSITIPDGVTAIGTAAFKDCTGLTSITIPASVTTIGDDAFSGCTGLESISVAAGNTKYDSRNNCNAIIETVSNTLILGCKTTVIPNTVTTIGNNAFWGCQSMTSITIPDGVTAIGTAAFMDCSALTSINIPASVTAIGNAAFKDCTSLTTVVMLPTTVPTLGNEAFNNCGSLTTIYVPVGTAGDYKGATNWKGYAEIIKEINGTCGTDVYWLYNSDSHTLTIYGTGAMADFENINDRPWNSYCDEITTVDIRDGVTSIGWLSLVNCSALTSITIPASVTSIGLNAFNGCYGLASVSVVPENTTFDSRNGCNAIIETETNTLILGFKTTVIPDGVMTIGAKAFNSCTGLTSITIPASVTSIGTQAFDGCTGLTTVFISATTPPTLDVNVFKGCTALTAIYVPAGTAGDYKDATNWKDYAEIIKEFNGTCGDHVYWSYDSDSKALTIFGTGAMAYGQPWNSYCEEIQTVDIRDGVTSIGEEAFIYCTSLTSITIPDGVTSIGDYAFISCKSLTSITIPDGVTSIGDQVFQFTGLTSINIPASVTSIGDLAFQFCTGLTSINIPNSVTSIGYGAFDSCTGLTSITIPDGVTSIGESAFFGCSSLTTVFMEPTTPPTLGEQAFYSCDALKAIFVPTGTAATYQTADNWSDYAGIIKEPDGTCGDNVYWSYNSTSKTLTIFGIGEMADYSNGNQPWNSYRNDITTVDIARSVTSIGNNSFAGCTSLTSITIPVGVNSIGNGAFANCSGLTKVFIQRGESPITTLGSDAFTGCNALNAIYVATGTAEVYQAATNWSTYAEKIFGINGTCGDGVYWSYANNTLTIFGTGVMEDYLIDEYNNYHQPWFDYYNEISTADIREGVTSIGKQAFKDCTVLTSINIPASVTSIGEYVLDHCISLESISVAPGNATYDSRNNCNAIIETKSNTLIAGCKNTVIPDDVTIIGFAAFQKCAGLTSIDIPNSVTTIGKQAFSSCTGLTSIDIPASVTTIDDWAFNNCTGLTSIDIPTSVTTIGWYAFQNCTGLTTVFMEPTTPPTLGFDSFIACDALTTIYVPVGTAAAYKDATNWRNYAGIIKEIEGCIPGDANGDGVVNVTDIMAVANYILSIAMDKFDATAADVSGDGDVNVTDIMGIANIILKVNTATSRAVRQEEDEVEPQ